MSCIILKHQFSLKQGKTIPNDSLGTNKSPLFQSYKCYQILTGTDALHDLLQITTKFSKIT